MFPFRLLSSEHFQKFFGTGEITRLVLFGSRFFTIVVDLSTTNVVEKGLEGIRGAIAMGPHFLKVVDQTGELFIF